VTAGEPRTLVLAPDKQVLTADGSSLSYVSVSVVDARGVLVPHADTVIRFSVSGAGTLTATDNGHPENAYGYTTSSMPAFNGRALAVVGATREPGAIRLTAVADGLPEASASLVSVAPSAAVSPGHTVPPGGAVPAIPATGAAPLPPGSPPAPASAPGPVADASYSGAPDTLPPAMLDGDLSTAWSNYYDVPETANLLAVSSSNPGDWVSLTWATPQPLSGLTVTFTTGGALARPASVAVSYWDGRSLVPVDHLSVDWAAASNQATTITFGSVTTTQVRLTMTSAAPNTSGGFLSIAELAAVSG
jgi:beta-galactosidase